MSITKPEMVKYIIPREGKSNGPLYKFGKEFHLFLIVIFSFSMAENLNIIEVNQV